MQATLTACAFPASFRASYLPPLGDAFRTSMILTKNEGYTLRAAGLDDASSPGTGHRLSAHPADSRRRSGGHRRNAAPRRLLARLQ